MPGRCRKAAAMTATNTASPHWRMRLKPENLCPVPAKSFAASAPEPNNPEPKKDVGLEIRNFSLDGAQLKPPAAFEIRRSPLLYSVVLIPREVAARLRRGSPVSASSLVIRGSWIFQLRVGSMLCPHGCEWIIDAVPREHFGGKRFSTLSSANFQLLLMSNMRISLRFAA